MNYNIKFKYDLLIIKNDIFNIDNVICDINYKNYNRTFLNIEYNINNILKIDGLFFQTKSIKLLTGFTLAPNCKNKYYIDLPLLNNNLKQRTIFEELDKKTLILIDVIKQFYNNSNSNINYTPIIKTTNFFLKGGTYEYNFCKLKLNTNECQIYYNNNNFTGDLLKLDFLKLEMKCVIQSYGVWKYDNTYGISWKVIKMELKDIDNKEINNIESSIIENNITLIDEEEFILNEKTSSNEKKIRIPNFELEIDDL